MMSAPARDWAWRQRVGSPTGKALLVALAEFADHAGRCWPAVASLAQRTELTERAVRRWLAGLAQRELLVCERRPGRSNCYRLQVGDPGSSCTPASDAPRHEVPPPLNEVQGTPAPGAATPAPDAPKPTITVMEPTTTFPSEPEHGRGRRWCGHGVRENAGCQQGVPIWPAALGEAQREQAGRLIEPVAPGERQAVADVLAAAMQSGRARDPLALLGALVRRWRHGELDTAPGQAVAAARERADAHARYSTRAADTDEVLRRHARMCGVPEDDYLVRFGRRPKTTER